MGLLLVVLLLGAAVLLLLWYLARLRRTAIQASAKLESLAREAASRQREAAFLRGILDMLPLPVWWRDADLSLSGCNDAYSRAVDHAAAAGSAGVGELGRGVIDKDGRGLAELAMQTHMPQSASHYLVIDGRRRLLEFTEAVLDPATAPGQVAKVMGYAIDATDLEEVQAELSTHIGGHVEVLESLGTAVAIFGRDRRLKFFNAAFARLWQIDPALIGGEPTLGELLEMLRERRRLPEYVDFQAFKQEQDRLFNALIEPVEELMHLPDGQTVRVIVSPHPLGGLLFVYENVTDRLALERSYNTLTAVQRETLNNLHEAVAVFGGDGRLKLWNPSLARMWGLAGQQLSGEPHLADLAEAIRGFFPGIEDWAAFKSYLVLQVAEPEARAGRYERSDGSVLDYAIVPLPDGGCLVTYIDVTDSVHVQRALEERNMALVTADRVKSEFIANVSYELRTPLNAIVGFGEVLQERYFGDLNVRQQEYVDAIVHASQDLRAMINDILDLASIEAGYMTLDPKPVDVADLMTGLEAVIRARAAKAGVTVELVCPPDIGSIAADATRLRQAVFNLLANAVKFTPRGGKATLSAEHVGDELHLVVSDTGVGIVPEDRARVFEKFERGDPHTRETGAGLGLALAKSLIELHGGRIELDSEPGKGARFTCRLPCGETGSAADGSDAKTAPCPNLPSPSPVSS